MDEVNKLGKILIVDDNEDVLFALNLLLEPYTEKIKVATTPDRIEHFMTTFQPDLILLDMNFSRDAISGQEGFESLKQILQIDPQAIVIFMTAYADTDKAVRAIKAGATDFIPKPWEKEKLLATLTSGMRLRQSQREVNILKEQVEALSGQSSPEGDIIGESPIMQEVFATINKLSSTDANILILGENGTGKDVIARLLYRYSPRYGKPFVTIDLGSIPEQLFESELFGFEKGAFTDAKKSKAGRMEVATNGTLFLDEIGNLSLPMQSKLLTAIEKRQISRLGSTQTMPIDVRLICATNADIRHMVDEGSFRQDLLYRINTIEIHIPPLQGPWLTGIELEFHFRHLAGVPNHQVLDLPLFAVNIAFQPTKAQVRPFLRAHRAPFHFNMCHTCTSLTILKIGFLPHRFHRQLQMQIRLQLLFNPSHAPVKDQALGALAPKAQGQTVTL